ncbi:hypothetical protein Tco_0752906 [Tanacetum coccineum]
MMVHDQEGIGEGLEMLTDPHHTPIIIPPSTSQPQKTQSSRRPKRKDTEIPQSSVFSDNVADKAINEEMDDSLERAATTATGLDAKQDKDNINKTQTKATPNDPSSLGTSSGGNTLRSGEDSHKLNELMEIYTSLQMRVLALKETKTTQATKIVSLKKGVDSSDEEESLGEVDASKQGRIADIDAHKDIYLVNVHTYKDIFGVND